MDFLLNFYNAEDFIRKNGCSLTSIMKISYAQYIRHLIVDSPEDFIIDDVTGYFYFYYLKILRRNLINFSYCTRKQAVFTTLFNRKKIAEIVKKIEANEEMQDYFINSYYEWYKAIYQKEVETYNGLAESLTMIRFTNDHIRLYLDLFSDRVFIIDGETEEKTNAILLYEGRNSMIFFDSDIIAERLNYYTKIKRNLNLFTQFG